MTDYATATAAPKIIKALGREYELSPLRFRSWGELEQFVRSQIIRAASDAAGGLPAQERDALITAAIRQASQVSLAQSVPDSSGAVEKARKRVAAIAAGEEDKSFLDEALEGLVQAVTLQSLSVTSEAKAVNAILSSPEGLLQVFYLSLKIKHSGITLDRVEEIAMDMPDDLAGVCGTIIEMSTGKRRGNSTGPKAETTA